jgi:glycosyltransferase involved in cell wall biosynthesis
MTQQTFFLNGRYLCQGLTGVQRVASNLVQSLDEELACQPSPARWVLLHPRRAQPPRLRSMETLGVGPTMLSGHAWEQIVLPWAARHGQLVSLAGSSPWLTRGQVVMWHDAAIFDHPEAYTRSFAGWYRALFRHLSRSATRILTPSEFSAARLKQWLPLHQLSVLPASGDHVLGVEADDSVLSRFDLRGRPFFLAVASANPTKNLALLRQAHAQWARQAGPGGAAALVLVGGSNPRVFRNDALSRTGGECIHTGSLSDGELKSLYQHALALVFPSIYEGFGIPPLEAMHCGCPVIAARAASLPEVCGSAAHYIDPTQPSSLVDALARVADDVAYREQLSGAGRARAKQFSWRVSAQRLLNLLGQNARSASVASS